MKTLFLFWHGLGDNILATPAIRQYKKQTGDYIGWMMMERSLRAKIFQDNPYVDKVHGCQDAWHCCGHDKIKEGSIVVIKEAQTIKEKYGVTMTRTDLNDLDWLVHLQEEMMDSAVYLERIIQDKRKALGVLNGTEKN